MQSIGARTTGLVGAACAILVVLAPAVLAEDFDLTSTTSDLGVRVKLGASGQAYVWRPGGC